MEKSPLDKIIDSLKQCDMAFLITVNGETQTTDIFTKNTEMTVEQVEDELSCAFMDAWMAESEQPEDYPSPIGRFIFEVDTYEDECCPECAKLIEEEIKLSEQN